MATWNSRSSIPTGTCSCSASNFTTIRVSDANGKLSDAVSGFEEKGESLFRVEAKAAQSVILWANRYGQKRRRATHHDGGQSVTLFGLTIAGVCAPCIGSS